MRTAALIFGVALVARLLHIWLIADSPFLTIVMGDSRAYDTWARELAAGDWIGRDVFYQAPLYPYFLGLVYATLGSGPVVVRVCQAVLGSAACVFLGLAGWRLFSHRVGLAAGLALALYPAAIFFDGLLQKAVLDGFFICLILWLVSRIIEPIRLKPDPTSVRGSDPTSVRGIRLQADWLWLGAALGGLSLTRENALVFVAVLAVWALMRDREEPLVSRARLLPLAAFVAGLALVLLPVAARNAYVSGGFFVTTSQFGTNFYLGNNPYTDGTAGSLRGGRGSAEYERTDAIELAERALNRRLTPAEVSRYWTGRAVTFITSEPSAWLRLMTRKVFLLWNSVEMLDTESQESYSDWSWVIRVMAWVGHFGVLVPLAILGVFVTWPDRRRLAVIYAMTLSYAASVLVFFIYARYRYPLVPFLLLFAAAGAFGASAYLRTRSRAQLVTLTSAIVLALVFTNWPMLSPTRMRAITEHNLGAALQTDGRIDEAIARYERAAAIMPDYAPAHNNLGTALVAKGRNVAAIASYEKALSIQSDYPNAHYNLANALLNAGRAKEAIDHFKQALVSSPGGADVHNNLGIALAEVGQFDEAVAEFQTALTFEPNAARVHRNLGEVLARQGRVGDALNHLRRAADLDPSDPSTHYGLAMIYVEQERLPEAVAALEATILRQPDSVGAMNDLAIILSELGRVDEAILYLERAVKVIQSANDPAAASTLTAIQENLTKLRASRKR